MRKTVDTRRSFPPSSTPGFEANVECVGLLIYNRLGLKQIGLYVVSKMIKDDMMSSLPSYVHSKITSLTSGKAGCSNTFSGHLFQGASPWDQAQGLRGTEDAGHVEAGLPGCQERSLSSRAVLHVGRFDQKKLFERSDYISSNLQFHPRCGAGDIHPCGGFVGLLIYNRLGLKHVHSLQDDMMSSLPLCTQ